MPIILITSSIETVKVTIVTGDRDSVGTIQKPIAITLKEFTNTCPKKAEEEEALPAGIVFLLHLVPQTSLLYICSRRRSG